ncbi:MAG: hypothetical protein BMS9Abin34_534 [Patescibacteria group bacterium]|nr:MAG: hypothetical protein BMS9Abin34_534 [Patescibacteria group bacterium]
MPTDEEKKELIAQARSQGPASREEVLEAAKRAAELDDQEGLRELIVERREEREAGEKTAVRIIVAMCFLVSIFLIGFVVAAIVRNPTLIIAFLAASIVFAIAAIITGGIYGFNRLKAHTPISKRG